MLCGVFKRPFLILAISFTVGLYSTAATPFSINISPDTDGVSEIAIGGGRSNVGTVNGCVKGSGREKTETRSLPEFSSVRIKGAFTVEIEAGREKMVQVSGDDNIVPLISTSVTAGKLTVSLNGSVCTAADLTVRIMVPNLHGVVSDGANDVVVRNVSGESFSISLNGASDARLSGTTGLFSAEIDGAGTLRAATLRSRQCRIRISGSGDAEVFASEMLDAAIDGAGDITYFGSPAEIKKRITGAGDIVRGD